MPSIEETPLPGVGFRHEFRTTAGERVGVVTHRTGRRDVVFYGREDPDAAAATLHLDEDESHALADLLGGSRVAQRLSAMLQQSVEGLAIEWLTVQSDWACAGHTIAESMLRTRTGVSVVAILRDDATIPSPTPDARIDPGDTLVAVGTQQGLRSAAERLQRGTA